MKASRSVLWVSAFLVLAQAQAWANEDGAYLDPPYGNIRPPHVTPEEDDLYDFMSVRKPRTPRKSDTLANIAQQTPVKSQASRGTCSIFSATAMLESMLVIRKAQPTTIDYSEEWLEYVIMRNRTSEGSSSDRNFRTLSQYGSTDEFLMPYIGETWETASYGMAKERCGHLSGMSLSSCLLAHRDPALLNASDAQLEDPSGKLFDKSFLAARRRAMEVKNKFLTQVGTQYYVGDTAEVKALLRAGIPLVLDVDFYYGAWNHRSAEGLGIPRNEKQWAKGIVTFPEPGSLDQVNSLKDPAGHSVLVVGYNDDIRITNRVKMADDTEKEVTYRGVYYIKNSWGTGSYGAEFMMGGQKFPGYGAMVQKYAHTYGSFYQLPLK